MILSNNKFYININGMGNQSFRIAEKVIWKLCELGTKPTNSIKVTYELETNKIYQLRTNFSDKFITYSITIADMG